MTIMLDHIFNKGTFMSKTTWNLRPTGKKSQIKREESDAEKRWTSKVVKFIANITPVSRLGDKEFLKVITELGEWTARRYMTS